jgi:CheY-like chemotaxis protein
MSGPKRTRSAARSKGHILLLVDDVAEVRLVLAEVLVRAGFAVVEASNGHEAVVKARTLKPDVVVMDVSLPLLDGVAAARIIRSADGTQDVPIIALTGRAGGHFDEHAFDGVLRKPCTPDVLLQRIDTLLEKRHRARSRGDS